MSLLRVGGVNGAMVRDVQSDEGRELARSDKGQFTVTPTRQLTVQMRTEGTKRLFLRMKQKHRSMMAANFVFGTRKFVIGALPEAIFKNDQLTFF